MRALSRPDRLLQESALVRGAHEEPSYSVPEGDAAAPNLTSQRRVIATSDTSGVRRVGVVARPVGLRRRLIFSCV